MTASLVSSSWRAASFAALTRLSMCIRLCVGHRNREVRAPVPDWNIFLPEHHWSRPSPSPEALASRLRVFTGVTDLALTIKSQEDLALLGVPGCTTKLKNLELSLRSHNPADFAAVTGLTRLKLWGQLDHCWSLVSRCAWLRVLLIMQNGEPKGWLELLPHLTGLPHLRELGWPPLAAEGVASALAALTQLTALRCNKQGSFGCRSLVSLTAIQGLRALSLGNNDGDGGLLERFLSHVPRLEEVVVGECGRGVTAALGSLTHLTKLQMACTKWPETHGKAYRLWRKVRGRLDLDVVVPPPPPPFRLPATLVHLKLTLRLDHYCGLLRRIGSLTSLTHLTLRVQQRIESFLEHKRSNRAWRRVKLLKALTRLQHLDLGDLLHVDNAAEDIRCLATLTQLTYLRLATYPIWGCSCRYYSSCWEGRVRCEDKFKAFKEGGGFLPLTSLTRLSEIWVEGVWWAMGDPIFKEPFNKMRHSLGRPPFQQYWFP
eukprot:jgi/Botrbrau1/16308/Bobra.0066s0076.1